MKLSIIFLVAGVLFCDYCMALVNFNSKPTISTITDGGMDIIGSITTLAQAGRERANGDSFITIYYEEYTIGGGKTWSKGARLYPSNNDTSSFGYSVSLGQSLKTLDLLFSGTPTNNSVYVFQDTRTHWSQQQLLQVRDSNQHDMFGYSVQVNKYNPDRLIVGAPFDDDMGLSSGSAYIFNGSPNGKSWTLNQKLLSTDWHSDDMFGQQVTIADGMAAVTSPGNCKVYLYSEDIPGVRRASLSAGKQSAHADNSLSLQESPTHRGLSPDTSEDMSEATSYYRARETHPAGSASLLKWTEQQVLQYPGCLGSLSIAQYGKKLLVGVNREEIAATLNVGAVYYLEGKTYIGACGGDYLPAGMDIDSTSKQHPTQSVSMSDTRSRSNHLRTNLYSTADIKICTTTKWTEMQKLVNPYAGSHACQYFGTDVDIYEDILIISSQSVDNVCPGAGVGTIWPYQYTNTPWRGWSVTNQLNSGGPLYSVDGYGGNEIAISGMDIAVSTTASSSTIYTYTGDAEWSCVVVNLGDKFSDGWSGAEMVITSPNGDKERHAPYCDSVINAAGYREMRWCPNSEAATGEYTFEIIRPEDFPFFWEIAWNVYQEYNGVTVYGDHTTTMTVNFEGGRLTVVSTQNRLEPVSTGICQSYTMCQVTLPPTPYPSRAPTPSPTPTASHTMPPTPLVVPTPAATTAMVSIVFYDSGSNSWFGDYNQGTGYSITDRSGKIVYARGLMCQYQAQITCWYELPVDTKLVFRLSGALDVNRNQHSWSFCYKTGTSCGGVYDFCVYM